MVNKLFFILGGLLVNLSSWAQSSNITFWQKADSLFKQKDYIKAAQFYTQYTQVAEYKGALLTAYYNAACSYALAGDKENAFKYLQLAIQNGWTRKEQTKTNADLNLLHDDVRWNKLVAVIKEPAAFRPDPSQVKLVTSDITNYWRAYDLAQKDTTHAYQIYKKEYIDKGSAGLQDYFALKIGSIQNFVAGQNARRRFYRAIRWNTLKVNQQKEQILKAFVALKNLYPEARFPNVYFVIGNFSSGGTVSENGLLIGLDQSAKSPEVPTDELTLRQKSVLYDNKYLPYVVVHESIHFQQDNMAADTTLLMAVIKEGMADFMTELLTSKNPNYRLHTWAKGKEKQIWADFRKEMHLNRARNWIANGKQETKEKPADLGYWVGYQICKAYYNQAGDKKQAVKDMLHIKDYRQFWQQSKLEQTF